MPRALSKSIAATALAVTLLLPTAAPSAARDPFVDAFVVLGGAVIANEIIRNSNQPKRRGGSPTTKSGPSERTAIIQQRLNALGFDAGAPDGLSGPRTRGAIRDFQESIGEDPTGTLDDEQYAMLIEQAAGIGGGAPMAAVPGGGAAFPALGAPDNAALQQSGAGFPALGTPAAGPGTASPAFPALGTAAGTQPAPAFPTIGTAPAGDPEAPKMPLVAGASTAAIIVPAASDRSTELARTSIGAEPAMLGFTLGASAAEVEAALAENSFGNCVGTAEAQLCTRETATLRDTVKTWSTAEDGVWAVARLIQFAEPVPADFVRDQFATSYPDLMASDHGLVASGEACAIQGQPVQALAPVFDARTAGAEIDEALLRLSVDCPLAYAVTFNEGNGLVAAAQTLFFDGTSVVRQHLSAGEAKRTQLANDLQF